MFRLGNKRLFDSVRRRCHGPGDITLHPSDSVCKNVPFDLISTVGIMASTRGLLFLPALLLGVTGSHAAQVPSAAAPLSVEQVLKLCQGGFSEDLIITRIKQNGKPFNLSTEELVELKNLGVSENIIKYLLDPSQPYSPPAPPAPSPPRADSGAPPAAKPGPPPRKFPEDEFASRVPPEPGLYRFIGGAPLRIDLKMFLGENAKPGLGKLLMKKGKVNAYLVGSASRLRINETVPVFYIRLPEGKGIEELVLVSLDRKDDRREIEMGPPGPKPELKPETLRQYDSLEVGPGVFRLTPSKLAQGEFVFFLISSAEPAKGTYGKGYDFGIDLPKIEKNR